jgi:hypothetical protein
MIRRRLPLSALDRTWSLGSVARLHLQDDRNSHANDLLAAVILNNDELIQTLGPALKIFGSHLCGRFNCNNFRSTQIGVGRAFLINDPLAVSLSVKEVRHIA